MSSGSDSGMSLPEPSARSRRAFLAAAAAVPLAAGACQWLPRRRSRVGMFPADGYDADFAEIITRGFRELDVDLRGRRVLLKPNLVEYEPGTVINTHPLVVAGAAVACRRAGAASVVVAEGPGHRREFEDLVEASGLAAHLRDHRVPVVDLNHDDVQVVRLATNFTGLGELALPAELLRADFVISMPKLKTHHWAGLTCSMKNLFGVVPGAVYGWPKNLLHLHGIDRSIIDLTATVRPSLSIVDAVVGMEGDGPIMGSARPVGFIGMSTDPVALDATCARVIGLDPRRIVYLEAAGGFLGNIEESRIVHLGERPARYATRFDILPELSRLRAD